MNEWLTQHAAALPPEAGELDLSEAEIELLLDLARIAAHESGDRKNAPLLCYLVGVAAGRSGKSVDELAQAVRSSTS
jgi:hypothetical protein